MVLFSSKVSISEDIVRGQTSMAPTARLILCKEMLVAAWMWSSLIAWTWSWLPGRCSHCWMFLYLCWTTTSLDGHITDEYEICLVSSSLRKWMFSLWIYSHQHEPLSLLAPTRYSSFKISMRVKLGITVML